MKPTGENALRRVLQPERNRGQVLSAVAERGGNDLADLPAALPRILRDGSANRVQDQVARVNRYRPDDDALRVQNLNQVRDADAHVGSGLFQNLPRERITCFRGLDHMMRG